ncbi:MAG: glycosyltransferase family 39 protein, partial [Anaerolineae bacterium]|nr:glycosyltransferase family 39 protein [Anaerolineae bacterium]
MKQLRWVGVPFLLGLLAAQMFSSSVRKSATFDEPYHLAAGYAYLRTGDPRLSWEHPPLVDGLAALPLLLRSDVVLPLDHPTWAQADVVNFADVFLWQANFNRAPELVVAARWPVMGLAVLLGLTLFLALRRFAGEPAAWLGLILFTLDPNVVANGRLVTTDLGLACFLFIATWRLGAYLTRPTVLNLLLAGLSAGLTLCAKFSGVLVGPAFLLVTLLYRPPDRRELPLSQRLLALAGMGL